MPVHLFDTEVNRDRFAGLKASRPWLAIDYEWLEDRRAIVLLRSFPTGVADLINGQRKAALDLSRLC
jgi:hypothetical protein